ncbi:hypothetical protein EW146_g2281 [Bondarzewia mesenterica]|uniref:BZIP domain-containing protein n=1 Tax=Bondarzewia mesenterica TaxID=1095465 RepID=A0A4S4M7C7_9AGAM|nr:hypothetical protein EW146_g2281 [Bondarzewia mesenterica]
MQDAGAIQAESEERDESVLWTTYQAHHLIVHALCFASHHAEGARLFNVPKVLSLGPASLAMPPSNLQGLNLVHPHSSNPYLSDSQDLLSNPHFPELNAQLDLWTNLAFESDEPLGHKGHSLSHGNVEQPSSNGDAEEEEDEELEAGPAHTDNHDNVVLGNPVNNVAPPAPAAGPQGPAFDINAILAGLGVDPFSAPPFHQNAPPAAAPSLAQILALYPMQAQAYHAPPPPPAPSLTEPEPHAQPPNKRARTRKLSVSTIADDFLESEPNTPDGSSPLSAAEDKRRRNTAASARFRLKKKEREAALEKKAKELEQRVAELERECEGLRRENGWLKGLVVGVTGAGAAQQSQVGVKRPRESNVEVESK